MKFLFIAFPADLPSDIHIIIPDPGVPDYIAERFCVILFDDLCGESFHLLRDDGIYIFVFIVILVQAHQGFSLRVLIHQMFTPGYGIFGQSELFDLLVITVESTVQLFRNRN